MKKISTSQAPAAIGPYSQAVQAGNLLFISGQIPVDPATGAFAGEDITTQTRQSLTNVRNILEAAGYALTDVVKTTVLLADMGDFAACNAVYSEFFTIQGIMGHQLNNTHTVHRVLHRGPVSRPLRRGSRCPAQGRSGGDRGHCRTVSPISPCNLVPPGGFSSGGILWR